MPDPHSSVPRSTHDLLFRILAQEMGLSPARSPAAQLLDLLDAFEPLKASVMAALEPGAPTPVVEVSGPLGVAKVPVAAAQDASLFVSLYDAVALLRALPASRPEEIRVLAHVQPLAGRVLFQSPELRAAVTAQLGAHHRSQAPQVHARNLRYLKANFQVAQPMLAALAH